MIIVLPIFLHGVSSLVTGGSYLGAGFSEFSFIFTNTTGGKAAQSLNLSNINIATLRQHSTKAAQDFNFAYDHLSQLGDNLIVQGIINAIIKSNPQYSGFKNITNALALVKSMSEITYVLPELFLGFQSLQSGLQETLPFITRGDSSFHPDFNKGLGQLSYAFDNFSSAWNESVQGSYHGIKQALIDALPLQSINSLSNYININEFFGALENATLALLSIKQPFTQFLNGTYLTTIAMANLGLNKLNTSSFWMAQGIKQFIKSNDSLSKIATPPVVAFTIYPNGDGGKSGNNQTIEIPVDGVVKIAKDMNNLLIRFAYGGLSGIDLFQSMDTIMTSIGNINWNQTASAADTTYWNNLNMSVFSFRSYYDSGVGNLSIAGLLAKEDSKKSYGSLLDPVFVQGPNSFFGTLANEVNRLVGNFTDYGHVFDAFVNTTYAFRYFSFGSDLYFRYIEEYNSHGNSSLAISLHDQTLSNFTLSESYANAGYSALQNTVGINQQVKTNWMNFLGSSTQYNPSASLYAADATGILLLSIYPPISNQDILNIINRLALGSILGNG